MLKSKHNWSHVPNRKFYSHRWLLGVFPKAVPWHQHAVMCSPSLRYWWINRKLPAVQVPRQVAQEMASHHCERLIFVGTVILKRFKTCIYIYTDRIYTYIKSHQLHLPHLALNSHRIWQTQGFMIFVAKDQWLIASSPPAKMSETQPTS